MVLVAVCREDGALEGGPAGVEVLEAALDLLLHGRVAPHQLLRIVVEELLARRSLQHLLMVSLNRVILSL